MSLLSICFSAFQPVAQAASLSTLNFQARLQTNPGGGIVPDGNYNIEFKLYNASSSSGSSQGSCTGDANCLWTETRVSTDKVRVAHGYLTVNLGSVTPFPGGINWDQNLYLTMNIGGSGSPTWNGEMSPRLALTAVPYAFRAGQLATYNSGSGFTSTLSLTAPTGGNQTFQVGDRGAAGTYTLLDNVSGIQNTTSPQTANIAITSASSGSVATLIQGAASQSVDILDIKANGVANPVFSVGNTGQATFRNSADSTTAFQVQNAAGSSMFTVDTSTSKITTTDLAPKTAGSHSGDAIITTVDSTGDVGQDSNVVLGSDGFARIAYFDNTNKDIKFVRCLDADCITKNITTLSVNGSLPINGIGIAMGSDGFARITFHDGSDLQFAQCTNADCSTKTITAVDTTGITGTASSISMAASDGFARISFSNGSSLLAYIRCTNASCSTKVTTTVDSSSFFDGSKIVVASDGFARIEYYDITNADIKFIQCLDNDCSTKNTNTVDSTGSLGWYDDMTLGSDGFARITYNDTTNTSLKFAQCTNASCSTSNITTIDTGYTSGDPTGQASAITMASDGFARIAYQDKDSRLGYVQCTNAACTTNVLSRIDGNGINLRLNMVMGGDDYSRISYYATYTQDLRFARLTSSSGQDTVGGTTIGSASSRFGQITASGADIQGSVTINNASRPGYYAVDIQNSANFIQANNSAGTSNLVANESTFHYQSNSGNVIDVSDGYTLLQGTTASTYGVLAYLPSSSTGTSLAATNWGSGNIALFQRSGVDVVTIGNTGTILQKNSSNSANALRVQNTNATNILNVGTTSPMTNLLSNGDFETATTGWAAKLGGAIARTTTAAQIYYGQSAGTLTFPATTNSGTSFNVALTLGNTYSLSVYAKMGTASGALLSIGYTNTGGDNDCLASQAMSANGFTRYTCTFTVTTTAGTAIYLKQSTAIAGTIFVDAIQLTSGAASSTPFTLGTLQLNGAITAPVVLQNTNDSTTAFQIQNASGTGNILTADTLNNSVTVGGTMFIQDGTSSAPGLSFNSQNTLGIYKQATNELGLTTASGGSVSVVINGVRTEQFTTSGLALANGRCVNYSTNGSDASGPFDSSLCRDGVGSLGLRSTTTAQTLSIYNTYTNASNYERASLGFSGNTFMIDASAAGTGVQRAIAIGTAADAAVTVGSTSGTSTLTLGQSTASNTISIGNAAVTGTQTVNIGTAATGAGVETITIGSTLNTSGTTINAGTGSINLNSVNTTNGTIVKSTTSNSNGAFQVQNSSGYDIFSVDTAKSYVINNGVAVADNLLQNSSYEAGGNGGTSASSTGWFLGGGWGIFTGSSNAHTGNRYMINTAQSNFTPSTIAETLVRPGEQYYIEEYIKKDSGADGTANIAMSWFDKDLAFLSASTITCPTATTTYALCGGKVTAPANAQYGGFSIVVAGRTTANYYFDDAYLAKVTKQSPVLLQNSIDSTAAFQVQNAAGVSQFTVDTSGYTVNVNQAYLNLTGLANVATPTATLIGTGGTLANATYVYYVAAYNALGYSQAVIASPASIATGNTTSHITLSWSAVPNATGYYLYRASNGSALFRVNLGNVTTADDTGSAYTWSGTDYYDQYSLNTTTGLNLASGSLLSLDGGVGNVSMGQVIGGDFWIGNYAAGKAIITESDGLQHMDNNGNTDLSITSTGATTLKNRTNSATALRIQNANTTNILNVGTTSPMTNVLTNGDFETATTSWANKGTGVLTRVTTAAAIYYGLSGAQDVLTASGDGARHTTTLTLGNTYTLSFYARMSSGTATNINAGYTNTGGDNDCLTNQTVVSTGFTRFTCTFTVTTTAGTSIYFKQSSAVSQTIYVDGFQVIAGTGTQTPFTLGTLQLNGAITAPVVVQNTNDSTTAFQIQNATGNSNLLVADTLNSALNIGGKLVLTNTSNTNTATIQTGVTSSSYTLTLPTALGASGDCLKDTTGAGVLGFGSCSGSGVTTVGAFSGSSQANGASIAGNTITFGPADATNPGMISTGTQTIAGAKTFTSAAMFQGTSNSANQLTVKTASGGTNQNVLNADTTNERVTVGAPAVSSARLDVYGSGMVAERVYQASNNSNIADFSATSQGVGTVTTNGTATLAGSGTSFTTAFKLGDCVLVNSATPQLRSILTIASNTSMTVAVGFTGSAGSLTYSAAGALGVGTVSTTATSATVTGSSTTFTSSFKVGDSIAIDGEGVHVITAIASNISMTISPVATNTTATKAYARANYDPLTIKSTGSLGVNVLSPAAALHVQTTGTALTALTAQAASGQTADIFNVTDSSAATLFSVGSAGATTLNYAATTGTAFTLNATNASGTQTNGFLVNHNGAGAVTNGLNITNTTGTTTNGLAFTGTIGTDVTRSSGTLTLNGQTGVNLYVNNTTTNPVLSLSSTGQALFKNASNSSTAFQVQNSTGANFFTADTSAGTVSIDSIFQASNVATGAGSIGSWTTNTNAITAVRKGLVTVTANGYVYAIGGRDNGGTYQSTIYYAKLNSDGSTGTWTTASSPLPAILAYGSAFVSNGYLFYAGGRDSGAVYSTVYSAKLNIDGSIGAWGTLANALPAARAYASVATANGYAYIAGGTAITGTTGAQTSVYYAKINADGTTGAWTTSGNTLPSARAAGTAVVANGYLYYIGGDNTTPAAQSAIYYSRLNPADGSNAAFSTNTGNPLSAITEGHVSVVANGYLYVIGGDDDTTANAYNTVNYAKLNSDGTTGAWTVNTANPLTARRVNSSAFTANGYVYVLGGQDQASTTQATVYYASTARVSVTANLDLIGPNGGSYADQGGNINGQGTVGGSVFAGNIYSNGGLQVVGQSQFSDISVLGNATFRPTVDSTDAFQIQDSNGGMLFTADTTNGQVVIGQKTDTSGTDSTWTRVSDSTAGVVKNGGTSGITGIWSSVVYNGSMYVGTSKTNGAEVYRYDGNGSWTLINTTAGRFNTTTAIDTVASMAVYNGSLYIGTSETAKAELYRYDGGTGTSVFTAISTTTPGTLSSGGATSYDAIGAMAVFNGKLQFGANKTNAAAIYVYGGGAAGGADVFATGAGGAPCGGTAVADQVDSMVAAFGTLYIAVANVGTGALLCAVDDQGYNFKSLNSTYGTFFDYGNFANITGIDNITRMAVYNGRLTLAITDSGGAFVYQLMQGSSGGDDNNDTSFIRLTNVAGQIVSGGTSSIPQIWGMTVYNGSLFISTGKTNGAEIYRYNGGYSSSPDWTKVSQSTAGTVAASGTANVDIILTLQPFNNKLYAGTYDATSNNAEIYENYVVSAQSYALSFQASAGSTQQSGFPNQGSISFLADAGPNGGASINTSGAFLFSNGIITSAGAYDVAEDYATRDDSLQPGDIVAADTSEQEMVKRATKPTDTIVGVYSEKPALRLSQADTTINGGRAIPIALAGRVPVKVSSKNGVIKPGDLLTMSDDMPGVAVKVTKAGFIIGRSLGFYSDADAAHTGKVMTFMNLSWYDPGMGSAAGLPSSASTTQPMTDSSVQQAGTSSEDTAASANVLVASDITATTLTVSGNGLIKGNLTVNGTLTAQNLELSGHIITKGKLPTLELQPAAGSATGELHQAKAVITGNDSAGKLIITIGDLDPAIQPGDLVKVMFDKPFASEPQVVISARDARAAQIQAYVSASTEQYFMIAANGSLQSGMSYSFSYYAVQ